MQKLLPAETLVINLKMLMRETNINTETLSRMSGVSKRGIDYILSGERKASVEIAGKLAEAFGLNAWQLIMPSLQYDIAKPGVLDKLIENYSNCPPTSREYISHVAQRDSVYKVNKQ